MKSFKKKLIVLSALFFSAAAVLSAQDRVLVAYFSRVGISALTESTDVVTSASLRTVNGQLVGNTEMLAEMVHSRVGGDLIQIKTEQIYPELYRDTTDLALQEQRSGARPVVTTEIDLSRYDTIFVGYPNWWGTLPMALFTFFESYDFRGKVIVPFTTHEGSALGRSVQDMRSMTAGAEIRDAFVERGGRVNRAERDVNRWLEGLGY